MIDFKEEEINKLQPYINQFYTALNADYARAIWQSDVDILLPILERVTGKRHKMCKYCPSSKLNLLKKLGKIYYEWVEQNKNIEDYGVQTKTRRECRDDKKGNSSHSRGKKKNKNN